jgi:UDPglucose 6-dehydrogenase
VAALGAAFKPDSDDIRDAPALAVAAELAARGAEVTVYDPEAMDNARRAYPQLTYAESALDAIRDADALVLLTEWQEFVNLDPAVAAALAAQLIVVDARHALDADAWRAAGWQYLALGTRALAPVEAPALAALVS